MSWIIRANLTEDETKFYRTILYHATTEDHGQPWLRQAFYKLIPVAILGSRTMAVDKFWRVYIDFDRMREMGATYASGVLNHEVWHLLRKHHERFDSLPPAPEGYSQQKLANFAGDLEINDDIRQLLPNDLLLPGVKPFEAYPVDKIMEQYYTLLCEDAEQLAEQFNIKTSPRVKKDSEAGSSKDSEDGSSNGKGEESDGSEGDPGSEPDQGSSGSEESEPGNPDSSGDSSKGDDSEEGTSSDSGSDEKTSSGAGGTEPGENDADSDEAGGGEGAGSESSELEGKEETDSPGSGDGSGSGSKARSEFPKIDAPGCGSAAGNPEEYELPENDPNAPALDSDEITETLEKVAKDIKDWIVSTGVGSGKGNLLRKISEWADEQLAAKVIPWNQEFRGMFRTAYGDARGKMTYVRNRPARRQPVEDVIFPALRSPVPTVGIGIDVSGSNLPNLRYVLEEVMNIMKASGVRGKQLQAFAVDVEATEAKPVQDPLKLLDNIPLGGGTRMTPGYERLAEMGRDISILFTDGFVHDYPTEAPKGRKRTRYITCIIGAEHMNEKQVRAAQKAVGSWSKVIPISLVEKDRKVNVSL